MWIRSRCPSYLDLHSISIPSPRLKVPMSHNFLCEALGMHSESWVTFLSAMNQSGTPPSFHRQNRKQNTYAMK